MKNNSLKQIGFSMLVSMLVVACAENPPPVSPVPEEASADMIPDFFDKNIVLASGIDFQTGKSVVVNPITGNKITSCNKQGVIVTSDKNSKKTEKQQRQLNQTEAITPGNPQDCSTQVVDPSPELANALNSGEKIIQGTIRKNGKNIPARFVVSVSALYEGSNCHTYFSGGQEWEVCSTLQGDCHTVLPLSVYGTKNETVRRNVRNTCMQFIEPWKKPDCGQLHPVYRTAPNYTLAYKQYVWDTCRTVPLTPPVSWGARPR